MLRLMSLLYFPGLFKQLIVGDAFQGIEFSHALTIVFISIGICLGYFIYRLYKASQSRKSMNNKANNIKNDHRKDDG